MRVKYLMSVLVLLAFQNTNGQNLAGITEKKDTSFNNDSALRWAQRDFPNAKIATANVTKVSVIYDLTYSTVDNYSLLVDVFSPTVNNNKLPAIIFIHGGGWRTGDKSQHHELARELAARGYVIFTPSYRLSTHALYPAAVIDIKTAIKWVKAHAEKYGIDKEKLVLAGYSAGGQMAAFIGTTPDNPKYENSSFNSKESSAVNAVIDVDGILAYIHPESGEGNDSKSVSAATHYFGYSKEENPDLWIEASALTHVGPLSPPILFLNSSDARMHAGRDDYIDRLNEYGIYSEVHIFKAPHVFPLMDLWFNDTADYIDIFLKTIEIKND